MPNVVPRPKSKALPRLLVLGLAISGTVYYFSYSSRPATLNETTFVPYAITSREPISTTSFIITASPHHPDPSPPYLHPSTSIWRHAHWSVEFKQPEVQIARHYTPLPPRPGDDPTDGSLRFYIRTVGDGEMSKYLSRLAVGRDLWLRGPHAGFDLVERLGGMKDVVFLAGGTGLAPALQAAHMILEGAGDTTFRLLWAVRKREELQNIRPEAKPWWNFSSNKSPLLVNTDIEGPSAIARQLRDMKAKYGERLSIQVAIDEEGTYFRQDGLQTTLSHVNTTSVSTISGVGCPYHDLKLQETAYEFTAPDRSCQCESASGTPRGKKLFVVSGPEGFISHFAGPKVWRGGQETQGPIGGIVGNLQRQNAQLGRDWIVLKL